jgi:hypothetical protein
LQYGLRGGIFQFGSKGIGGGYGGDGYDRVVAIAVQPGFEHWKYLQGYFKEISLIKLESLGEKILDIFFNSLVISSSASFTLCPSCCDPWWSIETRDLYG